MVAVGVIWELPFRSLFVSASVIRLVVSGARVFVSRAYLSLELYRIMGTFTYVSLQLILTGSKLICINKRSIVISLRVVRELPLRVFFMSHAVLWSVICRARVSISRAKCLRRWNCVMRTFSDTRLRVIFTRAESIGTNDRSFMVAVGVIWEPPLGWLHVCEGNVRLILAWAWIMVVRAHIPRGRDCVVWALAYLCF